MPERLKWMRENEPLYWSKETELWIASGFEEVSYISKDQDLFTSNQGVRPKTDTIIGFIDEPEPRHGKLRSLINQGFTPRMVKLLEEKFLEITRETLDQIADRRECGCVTHQSETWLLIQEMR